jgi:protein SCO1/2
MRVLQTIAVTLVAFAIMGCGRAPRVDVSELRGWITTPPRPKPAFTLTSMHGEPYAFHAETEGYLTLVFFGYTYCPDICPIHMANIAAVLKRLEPEVANQIKVVFVTTDPERDTPERLREWLGNFDRSFVGLYGPLETVNEIQAAIGLPPARIEETADSSRFPDGYGVAHAAAVVAYTTDNLAHVQYAFGTRQEDWAHDLPRLVKDGPPEREEETE